MISTFPKLFTPTSNHLNAFGSLLVELIIRILMNKSETDSTKMSILGYCGYEYSFPDQKTTSKLTNQSSICSMHFNIDIKFSSKISKVFKSILSVVFYISRAQWRINTTDHDWSYHKLNENYFPANLFCHRRAKIERDKDGKIVISFW